MHVTPQSFRFQLRSLAKIFYAPNYALGEAIITKRKLAHEFAAQTGDILQSGDLGQRIPG